MADSGTGQKDFETLFQETSKMIYNLGLRLFRDADDAMDFAQEVYLRAYTRIDKFRGESRFSTWLYSLALNLGLNRLRREKKVVEDVVDPLEFANEAAGASQPTPDERVLASSDSELQAHVQSALQELPDAYRVPLLLFYYEKMPYGEIAEKLGLKEGTLKSNIHRGKIILRSKLRDKVKDHETLD